MPLGAKHGRRPVFLSAEVDEIGLVPHYVPHYIQIQLPTDLNQRDVERLTKLLRLEAELSES